MSDNYWSILALEPTADEREIRRAYARQLKLHRPDRDPEGFQALRQAFDWAMAAGADLLANQGADNDAAENILAESAPSESGLMVSSVSPGDAIDFDFASLENALALQARQLAEVCAQSPEAGLDRLQVLLSGDVLLDLDARMAFYRFLSLELAHAAWLDQEMLNRLCQQLEWPTERRCPWGVDASQWDGVLRQVALVEADKTWSAMLKAAETDSGHNGEILRAILPSHAKNRFFKAWSPERVGQVARHLDYLENEQPILFSRLAPEVVSFWRTRVARLHMGKKQWQRAGFWFWLAGCTAANAVFFWRVAGMALLAVGALLVLEPMLAYWALNNGVARRFLKWGRWCGFLAVFPVPLYKLLLHLNPAMSRYFIPPFSPGMVIAAALLVILLVRVSSVFRTEIEPEVNPLAWLQRLLRIPYVLEIYIPIPFASGLVCGLLGGKLLSVLYLV